MIRMEAAIASRRASVISSVFRFSLFMMWNDLVFRLGDCYRRNVTDCVQHYGGPSGDVGIQTDLVFQSKKIARRRMMNVIEIAATAEGTSGTPTNLARKANP